MKYIKWVLGLERSTPKYVVLEETKRNELRIEAGRRAKGFDGRNGRREDKK